MAETGNTKTVLHQTMRVRQKNGAICFSTKGCNKRGSVLLHVLFEARPGWLREDNCPWHLVLGNDCSNAHGMHLPVDIIHSQLHNFCSAQGSVVCEQHNRLVSGRES